MATGGGGAAVWGIENGASAVQFQPRKAVGLMRRRLQSGPHQRTHMPILLLEMLGAKVQPFGPHNPVGARHPRLLPFARHAARNVTPVRVTSTLNVTLSVADTLALARNTLPAGSRKPAITPITVVAASSPIDSVLAAPGVRVT